MTATTDGRSAPPLRIPVETVPVEALRAAVGWATLAPSGHNTQPWRFRVGEHAVDLRADRTRALPVADPDDRELTIACGAALFHLRLALRSAGITPLVDLLPDERNPDLLARVRTGAPAPPTAEEEALFAAIPRRRTNRRRYEARPVPDDLPASLQAAAAAEGAWAVPIDGAVRTTVAELVEHAVRSQWEDPHFRRELAAWLRPASRGDGLASLYLRGIGPRMVRAFNLGKRTSGKDRDLIEAAPLLVVIGTDTDTPRAWLATGRALAHMLLQAQLAGVDAAYHNEPIQRPEARPRLARAIGVGGCPQLLVRFGYGPPVTASPRRPVADVLIT
jgi:hypothetical protein